MEMIKFEMEITKEMLPFVQINDSDVKFKQQALLLYPYIENLTISHGKAAEILGMNKLDLIVLYGKLGITYFNQTIDDLATNDDIKTIELARTEYQQNETIGINEINWD